MRDEQMGSQILEILRQGVWASLTGGWFYDPHQDVFCNTFHLYVWLFLLCLPFTIYVYFPPTRYVWYFYGISVTIVLTIIKLLNYGLHYMYDTTECIKEEVEEEWNEPKRGEEGIELQVLSNKSAIDVIGNRPHGSLTSYTEAGVIQSTDADSIDSVALLELDPAAACKPSSTIDLKAEVHRKNSSESSEDQINPVVDLVTYNRELPEKEKKLKRTDRRKHQRSKTDSFVTINVKNERPNHSSLRKRTPGQVNTELQENSFLNRHRPSLQSIDSEQGSSRNAEARRHSNFTNSSLNHLPSTSQNIKPTGSLELSYIDKNPNQALTSEGFYFDPNNRIGVRRIRSTALETCTPPPSLTIHPNSLEIIGCKSSRNPLPPPSSTLIRNQHLNLCPYSGSEIVYPIAEQSDEHQTSHGPDTDLDSLPHNSDSDFDENARESHYPYFIMKKLKNLKKNVPCNITHHLKRIEIQVDDEQNSATSKDALLDNDNSTSSDLAIVQDVKIKSYELDNEASERKLSGSNLGCIDNNIDCNNKIPSGKVKLIDKMKLTDSDIKNFGEKCGSELNADNPVPRNDNLACNSNNADVARKKAVRRNKRKKSCDPIKTDGNCSSLVKLDLEWLFDDEHHHLQHKRESFKLDTDWASSSTISLEQDVSKVLQETVPSARSLGAIPKKNHPRSRAIYSNNEQTGRKTPKSESDKCSMCRAKSDQVNEDKILNANVSTKENKVTQTQQLHDTSNHVEGLECIVVPTPRIHTINFVPKRYIKPVKSSNGETSSGSSNNELTTLLTPAQPLLSAFMVSRRDLQLAVCLPGDNLRLEHSPQRGRLKRSRANRRRSSHKTRRDNVLATSLSAGHGKHCAKNFNDTSDGALHCFMDEHGNWVTYTFEEKGVGTANTRAANEVISSDKVPNRLPTDFTNTHSNKNALDLWDSNSGDSMCNTSVILVQEPPITEAAGVDLEDIRFRSPPMNYFPESLRRRMLSDRSFLPGTETVGDILLHSLSNENSVNCTGRNRFKIIQANDAVNNNFPRTKTYYKFKILPWTFIKVTLDRLKLLALLDRTLSLSETIVSIFLGVLVSVLGAVLLCLNFYEDILAFIFCFVIASCQYSLLKSVQPDAASPMHGFNRIIAYSRPIYFCLLSSIILILNSYIDKSTEEQYFLLDNSGINIQLAVIYVRDFLIKFILFFPLLFSLGLFPQINTFIMYFFEQVDMHIFGGNAMSSLLASFYCIFRSIMAVLILSGLAYGSLSEIKGSQHILFSMFSACLVACSYHLSRSASDPSNLWNILKKHLWPPDIYKEHRKIIGELPEKGLIKEKQQSENCHKLNEKDAEKSENDRNEHIDPLPHKLQKTVNARLRNDIILCGLISVLVCGIHASTVFTVLQPELSPVLWFMAAILGFILHYVIPQLRKQLPWMCIARPVLRSCEYGTYQIRGPAKTMWFERVYVCFCFLERNVLYPLLFLSVITEDAPKIVSKMGPVTGSFIVVICGLKCLRCSYSNQNVQYLILTFTTLFFKYDYKNIQGTFLVQYFFMSIFFHKVHELLLKVQFVVTYIAPWQITWGSAFHAFAQPFSVPHSTMLFLQAIISAALSTPLNPFLGSAIFLTSYVRPIKFWERDYNTRRVDHSNTPLSSHLDRNLGADDNNLNSIFYEHLTRSLQHSLCGDLIMGRWGAVNQGDCFVLASDYLNCLVHIIELGNGLVTFQMRGLEFRGTYCQQREVEAITEGVEENDGCCCCDTGHLPNMLSVNAAFSQRWLAWEVTASKYILEGYSISDNSAVSMFQVFEFRRVLVSYYVKSIIFYTIRSAKLEEWITSQAILKALVPMQDKSFVDLDPVFNYNIDEDYDVQNSGMTKNSFCQIHGEWIKFCAEKSGRYIDSSVNSVLVVLCFALSLLGRRTLGTVSHNTVSSVEFFLYGLHALFKGDFRITCARDEWVFSDMDLLKTIVAPGVRMSLKLHQDHFMSPDEYDVLPALFDAISKHEEELVISHEGDPAWRNAILSGTPSLLALRHVLDDGTDEYKIIMLNKRYLSFRVIKINKECVRGLWAGQQQELVYLRNRNPERGSIQNAKQALRNIINSSCDQPIGYPIYVSPLTTSYADTNEQYCNIVGGSVSLSKIKSYVFNLFRRVRKRCGEGCSSGASGRDEIGMGHEGVYAMTPVTTLGHHHTGSQSIDGSHLGGSIGRGSSLSRNSLGANRGSLVSMGKPTSSTLASLAGLFKEKDERAVSQAPDAQTRMDERLGEYSEATERDAQKVVIIEPNFVYDGINLGRRIDVCWPTEFMRTRGGRSFWNTWVPESGMEGYVVHKWTPGHRDPSRRSHVDRTILLVQIDDKFIPIAEQGVQEIGSEL